jgi:dipeptidyl aminopeptidase/acylaminoacyl peptidase
MTGRARSGAGAANWISMYAQSDMREFRTPWFGGTSWQANAPIDLFWDHSPLKFVSQVKTPTLFLVGEQDPRVPMRQSIQMYRALQTSGVPTHLYVAPREGHGWSGLRCLPVQNPSPPLTPTFRRWGICQTTHIVALVPMCS